MSMVSAAMIGVTLVSPTPGHTTASSSSAGHSEYRVTTSPPVSKLEVDDAAGAFCSQYHLTSPVKDAVALAGQYLYATNVRVACPRTRTTTANGYPSRLILLLLQ